MNRLGWIILALFALVAVGVASRVRIVDQMAPTSTDPAQQQAAPAAAKAPVGGLLVPVAGVAPAQLVDSFGDPRGGGTRGHGALDIPAPRGTAVIAAAPGTIEKIFESEAGGHTVYVRVDGGGWVHYYAHLDSYAPTLREGQHVARGDTLGTVGSTGNADPSAPHLHFEIKRMAPGEKWYQGTGINPWPLLTTPAR